MNKEDIDLKRSTLEIEHTYFQSVYRIFCDDMVVTDFIKHALSQWALCSMKVLEEKIERFDKKYYQ